MQEIARTPVNVRAPLYFQGRTTWCQKSRAITNLEILVNRFRFP